MFVLQKAGQGNRVKLHRLMTNEEIYKFLPNIFALSLIVSDRYIFSNCCPSKSRSRSRNFRMNPLDGKCT